MVKQTSTGSLVSLMRRPPSPLCVISSSIGPSRSTDDALLLPFETPSGFFLRRLGCESAGRRRTWNIMDPIYSMNKTRYFVNAFYFLLFRKI